MLLQPNKDQVVVLVNGVHASSGKRKWAFVNKGRQSGYPFPLGNVLTKT